MNLYLNKREVSCGHHKTEPENSEAVEEVLHERQEEGSYNAHQGWQDNGEDSLCPSHIAGEWEKKSEAGKRGGGRKHKVRE